MDIPALDRQVLWHPFTQHAIASDPLVIERAEGAYLYTDDGRKLLDGISSWWVCLHGHCEPAIAKAIAAQVNQLDHVLFAGVTHPLAVKLAASLIQLTRGQFKRVFFSDNGSTAVEVALKIAVQWFALRGENNRKKFIAFKGSYHGDTFGAMSVSERGVFTSYFQDLLFEVDFIDPPKRGNFDICEASVVQMRALLADKESYAGFIYEPIVQGAGGMQMQEISYLEKLIRLAKDAGLLCLADEVMTGFYRTGRLFASDFLQEKPDLMCLAKGLTGGVLPLAVTLTSEHIFTQFLALQKQRAFFHGHSYTANPIGCAAALASLSLLALPGYEEKIRLIEMNHRSFIEELISEGLNEAFLEMRMQGTILALEYKSHSESGYFNQLAEQVLQFFPRHGVLLRPLGNVIYLLPPYCVSTNDLRLAYDAIKEFSRGLYR